MSTSGTVLVPDGIVVGYFLPSPKKTASNCSVTGGDACDEILLDNASRDEVN
jgi:hypothetical protein